MQMLFYIQKNYRTRRFNSIILVRNCILTDNLQILIFYHFHPTDQPILINFKTSALFERSLFSKVVVSVFLQG